MSFPRNGQVINARVTLMTVVTFLPKGLFLRILSFVDAVNIIQFFRV